MDSIRHALRLAATIAVAVAGFALVLFLPDAGHVKMGGMSLGGGIARADVPNQGYTPDCSSDSDACGGCADSDADCG